MASVVNVMGREFGRRLFLVAGPCVVETEELSLTVAKAVAALCDKLGIDYIFKASYDKANRSSIDSERGPGISEGLDILALVREKAGVPVLSDIHLPEQAEQASGVLDVLQIPAFLSRQTDLLVAAAQTTKPVNVKKGQFLAPWDMENVIRKLESADASGIMLTERGTCFGYNNLVTDPRSIAYMKRFGYPVVMDATHSVQLPGGRGASSGGERQYVETVALSSIAAGADGLFLEVHPDPANAPCDSANMLPLSGLEKLLAKALAVYKAVREPQS